MYKTKKQKGFTLIELIIVIVIVSIIVAGSSNLLSVGFRSFISSRRAIDENWQSIVALESMSRDLRTIRSNSDITSADDTSITFNSTSGETITYSMDGSTLERGNEPLADDLQDLSFEYYDVDGTSVDTSTPSEIPNIRYIVVNPGANKPTVTVQPWNLK